MHNRWFQQALYLPQSPNKLERECVKLGVLEDNGAPMLLPISLIDEHMHVEGTSGSGKTAGLTALLEQLRLRKELTPRRTFLVIDMKGDTPELFHSVAHPGLPVRWFIDRVGYSTFPFNLFQQRYWQRLTPLQKASTLAAALGTVTALAGYGVQWFQGACLEVLFRVFEQAEIQSFSGLAEAIHNLIIHGRRDDLHSDIRAAGLQAYLDVRRVGSVQALNVVDAQGIDLCSLFEVPQVLYISLPSAGSHSLAGVMGRLFLGALFDAAAAANRSVPVTVVVDEWHRLIAGGLLETTLTQARSCGIGLILANQTIDDLDTKDKDFRPTLKACCRLHWLFGLGSGEAMEEFSRTSGEYEMIDKAWTEMPIGSIWGTTSISNRRVMVRRYPFNEVARICSDPRLSFFTASQDAGMYRYGALPQAVKMDYHITREEYECRKRPFWPAPVPGCIVTEMPAQVVPEPEEPPPPTEVLKRPPSPKRRGSKE